MTDSKAADGASSSMAEQNKRVSFRLFPELLIGVAAAVAAVGLRYPLPLQPTQLPTLTAIVAVALTSTFVGWRAGVATALTGGLLSWYFFFEAHASTPTLQGAIPLFGFAVITSVIIMTTHLYRRSEQRRHEAELHAIRGQAEAAQLFAREMAHRLKNALAIIQSIASQTLGAESADAGKLACRIKALADVHDLLSEHVERPSARVVEVIQLMLESLGDAAPRVRVECPHGVSVEARQAVSLSLALHELGANALSYGALSNAEGSVSLTVQQRGDCLRVHWREHRGPSITAAPVEHFGSTFLRRMGSGSELAFEPGGVRCTFEMRALSDPRQEAPGGSQGPR